MGNPRKFKALDIGQKVFVVPINNCKHQKPFYATVKKVGNKLFELEEIRFHHKFELKTFREYSNYLSNYQVYKTKLEYDNEVLSREFIKQIVDKLENMEIKIDVLGDIGCKIGLGTGFIKLMEEQYKPIG